MCTEIIHHKGYFVRFRILLVRYPFDEPCPVLFRFPFRDLYEAPAFQRLVRHEYIDHPMPDVLIVHAGLLSRFHWNRKLARRNQLFGGLVHTDQWVFFVVGPFVNVQHLFHVRDKTAAAFWRYDPALYFPGLKFVFFKTFPTETCEILGTYSHSTILSANNLKVHLAKPVGGSLQQSWISFASASPSIFLS